MNLKKLGALAFAVATIINTTGCGDEASSLTEPPVNPDYVEQTTEATTEAVTEAPAEANIANPLTGEKDYNADAVGKRPVAVMVNNLKDALPQYGIEQADIIYEIPVEGGITRLMAVYADYTSMPDICSVRSCRYYYPIIALGMDAIYCHWGADQTIAMDTLNRTGIDRLDGANENDIFLRDDERAKKYASEHTGYLKGSAIPGKIESKGFRRDINSRNAEGCFNFAEDKVTPADMTAVSVQVKFSNSYYSDFEYDEATGEYLKFHSGKPHIDGRTEKQLGFENVIILQSDIHTRSCGYLMDVGLTGGTGYYVSNGGAQSITWKKESETSPIKLYDASGSELEVNVGESYIGIIGSEKPITIE
ncbi:MAG: DUF3048 domain-containing protein [Ruminococcus sp.]|nr:DUF3048 domain-containing protein [Ruminococcus sp.]